MFILEPLMVLSIKNEIAEMNKFEGFRKTYFKLPKHFSNLSTLYGHWSYIRRIVECIEKNLWLRYYFR